MPGRRKKTVLRQLVPWLYLAIPLAFLATFTYIPVANMFWYSVTSWDGLEPTKPFVGLTNYFTIFTNSSYFSVFFVSLYYLAGAAIQIVLALYFATLLSFNLRFRNLFKGILFFPYLINGVAIAFIFLFFFQPGGTLDLTLQFLGLHSLSQQWLGNPAVVNQSLAAVSVWRYMGLNMILYIGAIQSINPDLYEAAELDGASSWHRFRSQHQTNHRTHTDPRHFGKPFGVRDPLHHARRRERNDDVRHPDRAHRLRQQPIWARLRNGCRAPGDRDHRDGHSTHAHQRRRGPDMKFVTARTLQYLSLAVGAIAVLLPLTTLLFASLKTTREYATTSAFTPPSDWFNFYNFQLAFNQGGMLLGFFNTTVILVISIVGTIILGTAAAYAIDRFQFRGKNLVLGLFLLAALVPSVTTQVATFQIVNALGLFDTRWSAVVLFVGTDIISIYIFLQFMASIPKSLDEAARIDGAGHFRIYTQVILPLLRPAIATVVIIKGIAIYNEFYIPFLYMPDSNLGVISTSLFRFNGPYGAHWEILSAGAIVVIIPTLVLFLLLQRFIYRGLAAGAVK
jgi:ABC-type glycerol-3-phosphate transport system permease component